MKYAGHITLLTFLAFASNALAADGFRNLLNGKNLDGWVNVNCAPETWRATNGLVYCTGFPTGALRTTRRYENFVLELEWRHLKSGGNAGVFVWSGPIGAPGVPFLRAVEVQVLDHGYIHASLNKSYTTHGDVFPIHGSTMEPFGKHNGQRSFPSEQHSKGSPEWNQYRIECNDGTLWLTVNGHKVSGGENCNWRNGYIALESEGSPVEFRNIRLKELPSTGATAKESAPIAQGHRSLYNGVDLRGWRDEGVHGWQASDWRLVNQGDSQEILWSDVELKNFELILDCKIDARKEKHPGGGIVLGHGDAGIELIPFELLTAKDGAHAAVLKKMSHGFHRLHIQVRNGVTELMVNGQSFALVKSNMAYPGRAGRIGLLGSYVPIAISGMYVRELK
jgi:hypothetical protein